MKDFFGKISLVFQDSILRKKILFTLGALVIFRVLSAVPVSGVDAGRWHNFFQIIIFLVYLMYFQEEDCHSCL
jgi:preprotein translocase subunit SecY